MWNIFKNKRIKQLEEVISNLNSNVQLLHRRLDSQVQLLERRLDKLQLQLENKPKFEIGKKYKYGVCIDVIILSCGNSFYPTHKYEYHFNDGNSIIKTKYEKELN